MNSVLQETLARGVAQHRAGNLQEAERLYRQILQADPNHADALHLLGVALCQTGRFDIGANCIRQALRLKPDFAEAYGNLGNALKTQGKLGEAADCFLQAVRLKPEQAEAHKNLGLIRLLQAHDTFGDTPWDQGKLQEAEACFRRALRLKPDLAEALNGLGVALLKEGKLDEAATCYLQALHLVPRYAEAHSNLGNVLKQHGKPEAVEHYRKAIELQPNLAAAYLNLGELQAEQGELAEAEAAFRAVLRLQQSGPDAHMAILRLVMLLRGKLPDADRAALEAVLADPGLGPRPRARLLFAQAHVLDALEDYGRAADCLRRANALTLDLNRRRGGGYAPAEYERYVDAILRVFDTDFFRRIAPSGMLGGSATRLPVFVFGLPRSGTTLIEQVLAGHSRVHGAGELQLVPASFEALPAAMGRSAWPLDCVAHLDAATIQRLARQHEDQLRAMGARALHAGAERVVDKLPENYMFLGFLAALFPQAVFIHCRRDLRDVAVSCWMTDFFRIRWANDPAHIASHFRQYRRLMDHWHAILPVPIHDVDYEEAVADLEGVARRLVAACGLEWEPACMDFRSARRAVRNASFSQVRQPIYNRSIGRWKRYERELADLFADLPATK